MLKALSAVSVDNSLLRVPPWRNPWLLAGVALPTLLHIAVLYTPAACRVFGLAPLTKVPYFEVSHLIRVNHLTRVSHLTSVSHTPTCDTPSAR